MLPGTEPITVPVLISGMWRIGFNLSEGPAPCRGDMVIPASESSAYGVNGALVSAGLAKNNMAGTPGYERIAMLRRAADLLLERANDVAEA